MDEKSLLQSLFDETVIKKGFNNEINSDEDQLWCKSDTLRSLMYQVQLSKGVGVTTSECADALLEQIYGEYNSVISKPTGLNNYAKEALNLAGSNAKDFSKCTSQIKESAQEILKKYLAPDDEAVNYKVVLPNQTLNLKKGERSPPNQKSAPVRKPPLISATITSNATYRPYSVPTSHNIIPLKVTKERQNFPKENCVGLKNKIDSPEDNFRTAKQVLLADQQKTSNRGSAPSALQYGMMKKTLGTSRASNPLTRKFIPPLAGSNKSNGGAQSYDNKDSESNGVKTEYTFGDKTYMLDPEYLKNVDAKMVEVMMNEILDHGPAVTWDDIAGLQFAKATIQEIVIWPLLRPDIFCGLRGPPKGILLFGPPGTGKTLIGKCIASQSKSTFFSISASSMTSKWVGEGEKLVRALFAIAKCLQPSVIFIDEIDSLLTQRSDTEHESSRRLKTEFLVQLDGAATSSEERILIVGATNRPQELDEAARRRLVKRLYIPLPEGEARITIVTSLIKEFPHQLTTRDFEVLCEKTDGYSGADMANLCKEASYGPIRELNFEAIEHIPSDQLRPIQMKDFTSALSQVRASVSSKDLQVYLDWNEKFGSSMVKP